MGDPAAGRLDPRRHHVGAVDDGARAIDQDEIGAGVFQIADGAGNGRAVMRHALFVDDRAARGLEPAVEDAPGLVENARLENRQRGRHDADPFRPIRRDARQIRGHGDRLGGGDGGFRRGEGDDLDGRHHLAGHHRLQIRQGGERDRLVDPVEPVDGRLVYTQDTGLFREQIGAAGKGRIGAHQPTRDRAG